MQYKLDTTVGYTPETLQVIIKDLNIIFEDVFGANWNTEISSSNGQFLTELAKIQVNNQNFIQYLYEVWDPDTSSGVFLESLCALLSIYKKSATASTVTVTCSGNNSTLIIKGSQIINTDTNDVFKSTADVTIPSSGSIDVPFSAIVLGAIPVGANIPWSIITNIAGWTTVFNSAKGLVGDELQSDNSLRANRNQLLAISGAGFIDSIYANLYELPEVKSAKVLENSSSLLTYQIPGTTYQMYQNSVFISLNSDGLAPTYQAIAKVIQRKKPPGINMNQLNPTIPGMQVVEYDIPLPQTYSDGKTQVKQPFLAYFFEAIVTQIRLIVNIIDINKNLDPSAIASALFDNWNGTDPFSTYSTPIINELIDVSRFIPTLLGLKAGLITSITIGLLPTPQNPNPPAPSSYIQLPINLIATLLLLNITVTTSPPPSLQGK